MATNPTPMNVLILGIGNVLWADEGFGVRAVELLHATYSVPPDVRVMDGGTQGMFLLPYVQQASKLLIFDAIDFELKPGEMRLIRGDDVPRYMGAHKISMHQTGFQEVLASARLTEQYPSELALVGVQPVELDDYGGSLRPQVKARLREAIELAVQILKEWGVTVRPRKRRLKGSDRISPSELGMIPYERDRPTPAGSD